MTYNPISAHPREILDSRGNPTVEVDVIHAGTAVASRSSARTRYSSYNSSITGSSPSVSNQSADGANETGHAAPKSGTSNGNASGTVKAGQNASQSSNSNGNATGAGGGGHGTSKSGTSEDEGGGDDEEDEQGLKHSVLKPLLDKVTDLFVNIMAIIIATMFLKWLGFL